MLLPKMGYLNVIEFHDGALHHHLKKHEEFKEKKVKKTLPTSKCFVSSTAVIHVSQGASREKIFVFPFPTQPETVALKVKFMNWT